MKLGTFPLAMTMLVLGFSSSRVCEAKLAKLQSVGTAPASLEKRVAAQEALFRDVADSDRDDNRDPSSLGDFTLHSAVRSHQRDQAFLSRLVAIATKGLPEEETISHQLLLRQLRERMGDFTLKQYEMPVTQLQGPHLDFADLPRSRPFDSTADYEHYIRLLQQIPRGFQETMAVMRQGERDNLMPPRMLLDQVAVQCEDTVREDPFLNPLHHFPESVSSADRLRITSSLQTAIQKDVLPAYREFALFMKNEYSPRGRIIVGLAGLPDGPKRYELAIRERTTTTMTASQIHALGLREVDRVNGLLEQVARRAGYEQLSDFRRAIKADSRHTPQSAEQIVELFRNDVTNMQTHLSSLFASHQLPPLLIEPVPASQPNNGTHYVWASEDGKRPARLAVQTSDYKHRSLISDETQAYHEGIPGHHLQISVQLQLKNLPEFRRRSDYSVFAEGWAVYAEALGKEIGMYQDPASDYGRLNLELMRAVRLVVDTGINADGWTRDQAVDYYRQSGATDEPTTQAEVDMSIARPARNLAYQIGKLRILETRHRAEIELGSRFDVRQFHERILSGGNLPMDLMEARVNTWIAMQKTGTPVPTTAAH